MSSSGIAWASDTKFKFRNSPEGSTGQFFPPFAYERQAGCDALSGALTLTRTLTLTLT